MLDWSTKCLSPRDMSQFLMSQCRKYKFNNQKIMTSLLASGSWPFCFRFFAALSGQNNAILGGDLQKKKKKGHRRFCCTFTITFGLTMPPNVTPTKWGPFFLFIGDVIAVTNFSAKYKDTFSNCPKTLQPAMRQIWRNAPRLATPAINKYTHCIISSHCHVNVMLVSDCSKK